MTGMHRGKGHVTATTNQVRETCVEETDASAQGTGKMLPLRLFCFACRVDSFLRFLLGEKARWLISV